MLAVQTVIEMHERIRAVRREIFYKLVIHLAVNRIRSCYVIHVTNAF